MSIEQLLARIDGLKKRIDSRRPLYERESKQLNDYFRIGVTYTSNVLEGNSFTLTETKVLLEDGITVGGKPLKDIYEASGHADTYDFILAAAKEDNLAITEDMILTLHRLFYHRLDAENAEVYHNVRVIITGTDYRPPRPEQVPELVAQLVDNINQRRSSLHPVLLAATAHHRLVDIHPFLDGNGRTARLLMNLILVNQGYPVVSIPPIRRNIWTRFGFRNGRKMPATSYSTH